MRFLYQLLTVVALFSALIIKGENKKQVLTNGTFEHITDTGIPANWRKSPKNACKFVKNDTGKTYARLTNPNRQNSVKLVCKTPIILPKDTDSILIKGRVNVAKISPGEKSWHDARITLTFKNKHGKVVEHAAISWDKPTTGWVKFNKKFPVNEQAAELTLGIAIFQAEGLVEVDDLEAWVIQYPKDKVSWSLDDAFIIKTKTRNKISLNGVWNIKLMPEVKSSSMKNGTPEPVATLVKENNLNNIPWATLRVPGEWYSSHWSYYTRRECMLQIKGDRGPRAGICGEKQWQNRPLKDYHAAWYERKFTIPHDWNPEDTYLRFDDFSIAAWIYVNSTWVASQEGQIGRCIPLPSGLKAGDEVTLNVLVSAEVNGIEKLVMGGGENYIIRRKKESYTRGIIGNVWLINQPRIRITDVQLRPSVRKKCLDILFRRQPADTEKACLVNVDIFQENGTKLVKKYETLLKAPESKNGKYKVSIPWKNPVLWTPEQPFLYTAKIKIKGAEGNIEDEHEPIRFGFREFWIKNGDYYLNGHLVHLRSFTISSAPKEYCKKLFETYKKVGYNTVYIHPVLQTQPTLDAADEVGMMIIMLIPSVHEYLTTWQTGGKDHWTQKITPFIKGLWNHPSVVHWAMSRNILGYPFDMLPQLIGIENSRKFGPAGTIVMESEKIVDSLDGSRPIMHHACGSIGQVHTSNIYLNFIQPQEKREWLLNYRQKRVKPFYAVELGMPYANTYYYGRKGFGTVLNTEPLHCEYAAMYLGEKAFTDPGKKILSKITSATIKRKASHGADKYSPRIKIHNTAAYLNSQRKLFSFIKDWRACGIGGLHPWATKLWKPQGWHWEDATYDNLKTPGIKTRFRYTPKFGEPNVLYKTFKKMMSPLLVYIGGKKEWFTDRRSNYFSGEEIAKTIVVVNDTQSTISIPVCLKMTTCNTKAVAQKNLQVSVAAGATEIIGFSFTAPDIKEKTSVTISLTSQSAKVDISDSIQLQILPNPQVKALSKVKRKIYMIGQTDDTIKLLKKMDLKFTTYNGETLGKNDLLIIARRALSQASVFKDAIKESLSAGANMLIFEQAAKDLKKYLGLRAFKSSSRRVFTGYGSEDVLPGVANSDLINWAGKSTAIKEYPDPGSNSYPVHIWKQGNTGIVSSVTIEKPQCGPFRALLHEGYNLNYTPLLLEHVGKGKALYCQLDLTARTEREPMTMVIMKKILDYIDGKSSYIPRSVILTGDKKSADILSLLGIDFSISNKASNSDLWIVDESGIKCTSEFYNTIKDFATNGGDIVILNIDSPTKVGLQLGLSIDEHVMTEFKFNQKKLNKFTKGLTNADWYWKDNMPGLLPEKGFPIREFKLGKGTVTFCQINPFCFEKSQLNQRRFASRIKMFRTIAHLLTSKMAKSKYNSCDYLKGIPETRINLEGAWKFKLDPDNQGEKAGWSNKPWPAKCKTINAPGCWEKQRINDFNPHFKNSGMPYDGYAWYQKELIIGEQFKNQNMYLEIGAIDDCDWIYVNGTLIGKTGKETRGWYAAKRLYKVPAHAIKYGELNLISIRVFDDNREGGIVTGPITLFSNKPREDFPYLETSEMPKHDPYRFERW